MTDRRGENPSHAFAYLDANVFLHFTSADEVPWPDLLETPRVTLIVAMVVLDELDDHKDNHRRSHLRDRARSALAKIERWRTIDELREGVDLEIDLEPPTPAEVQALGLQYNRPDDRLLASALRRKGRLSDRQSVVIVSNDTNVRLRAESRSLEIYRPADDMRLPEEVDELEREVLNLRQRLARHEAALPHLRLRFEQSGEAYQKYKVPMARSEEELVQEKLAQARRKYDGSIRSDAQTNFLMGISDRERLRYREECEEYLKKLEGYLPEYLEFRRLEALCFKAQLVIANDGGAPADDLDIIVQVPTGPSVLRSEPTPPEPPKPPLRPRSFHEIITSGRHLTGLRLPDVPFDVPRAHSNYAEPTIREIESHEVTWELPRLKHDMEYRLGPIWIAFGSREGVQSFAATYTIIAANTPTHAEGELHFVFELSEAA